MSNPPCCIKAMIQNGVSVSFSVLYILIFATITNGCASVGPHARENHQTSSIDGMEMILIPAGSFEMGSAAQDAQAMDDERPIHTVDLNAYWMDKTEITNKMYAGCITANFCTEPARSPYYLQAQYANHPIRGISWTQAETYCAWADRRLPSEAEWEKAARGTDGRIYPWGNMPPNSQLANFNQSVNDTRPVGSYPSGASPYGILDMAGNVWEWVADGYNPLYYSISLDFNPISDTVKNLKVLRGGNWDSNAQGIRSANRFWAFPGRNDTDGFRCAKSDKNGI